MVAGAEVEVVLAPEGPGRGTMGKDVDAALDAAPDARAFFESLPTFYRKNYARWLDSAKRPETPGATRRGVRGAAPGGSPGALTP